MRRIIEPVVTVVTTTWKISWDSDSPLSDPAADPVSPDLPARGLVAEAERGTLPDPTTIQAKEDEGPEIEQAPETKADEPPQDSYS